MRNFKLIRTKKYYYSIIINDIEISTAIYYIEMQALDWARAFVSSWQGARLDIEFETLPDELTVLASVGL